MENKIAAIRIAIDVNTGNPRESASVKVRLQNVIAVQLATLGCGPVVSSGNYLVDMASLRSVFHFLRGTVEFDPTPSGEPEPTPAQMTDKMLLTPEAFQELGFIPAGMTTEEALRNNQEREKTELENLIDYTRRRCEQHYASTMQDYRATLDQYFSQAPVKADVAETEALFRMIDPAVTLKPALDPEQLRVILNNARPVSDTSLGDAVFGLKSLGLSHRDAKQIALREFRDRPPGMNAASIARARQDLILTLCQEKRQLSQQEAEQLATHRHYKGGLYYRLFDALHTEDEEPVVVYAHLYPHVPALYVRPKLMFEGLNDAGEVRFAPLKSGESE